MTATVESRRSRVLVREFFGNKEEEEVRCESFSRFRGCFPATRFRKSVDRIKSGLCFAETTPGGPRRRGQRRKSGFSESFPPPKSDSSAPGRRTFRAGSEGESEKWPQGGRIGSDGSVRETTSVSPVWPDQVRLLPLGSGDAHPRASDTWSLDNECLALPDQVRVSGSGDTHRKASDT